MKVIAISGKAEHGKDYAAEIFKGEFERNGKKVLIAHFADVLKWTCSKYLEWDGKKDEFGRTLLQDAGSDFRIRDQNFFCNFLVTVLKVCSRKYDVVIIPDVRFENEIECLKENFDTVTVQVIRPGYKNHLTADQRVHSSETELDNYPFDYKLFNDGEDLLKKTISTAIPEMFSWASSLF